MPDSKSKFCAWVRKYCCCCCCCCDPCDATRTPLLSSKEATPSSGNTPVRGGQPREEGFSELLVQQDEEGKEEMQEQKVEVREGGSTPPQPNGKTPDEPIAQDGPSFLRHHNKKVPIRTGSLIRNSGSRLSWRMVPTQEPQEMESVKGPETSDVNGDVATITFSELRAEEDSGQDDTGNRTIMEVVLKEQDVVAQEGDPEFSQGEGVEETDVELKKTVAGGVEMRVQVAASTDEQQGDKTRAQVIVQHQIQDDMQ